MSERTDRERLVDRGLVLNYLTIAYNSCQAVAALLAGFLSGSVALVGFGFDSVIEVTAGAAALGSSRSRQPIIRYIASVQSRSALRIS